MVELSLDSNTVVDLIRGQKRFMRDRLDDARKRGATLKLSSVVLSELVFGAHLSPRPAHHMAMLDAFLAGLEVESWTPEDAVEAARLRADLEKAGLRIGAYDTLIAGQALNRGWTVVTANQTEFMRVRGLAIIDWSDADEVLEMTGHGGGFVRQRKRTP